MRQSAPPSADAKLAVVHRPVKRRAVLETIADCEDRFGAAITGGALRKRDVDRARAAGLVLDVGPVEVMNDDEEFTGRTAWGYRLTRAGRRAL